MGGGKIDALTEEINALKTRIAALEKKVQGDSEKNACLWINGGGTIALQSEFADGTIRRLQFDELQVSIYEYNPDKPDANKWNNIGKIPFTFN